MDLNLADDTTTIWAPSWPVLIAVTAAAHLAMARLAGLWAYDLAGGQPLWPAAGIVIGLASVVPRRARWVALVGGIFGALVDALGTSGLDLTSTSATTLSAAVEMGLGIGVFGFVFSDRLRIGRGPTTLLAFVLCFVITALATLPAIILTPDDDSWSIVWRQTLGHGLGVVAIGPVALIGRGPVSWLLDAHPARHRSEFTAALVCTLAGLIVAFDHTSVTPTYLVFAGLIWLAVRFGPPASFPAGFVVAVYASLRSAGGDGPFGDDTSASFAGLVSFLAVTLLLSAVLSRYVRGLDRQRYTSERLLDALPDLVAITTGVGGSVRKLSGHAGTLSAFSPAVEQHILLQLAGQEAPTDPAGVPERRVEALTAAAGDRVMVETRSVRVDRNHVLTVARDITETVRALEERELATDRWRSVADTAYEGLIELDGDLVIIFATKRCAEIFGVEFETLVGRRFPDLFRPEDYRRFLTDRIDAVAAGRTTTFDTLVRPDGSQVWLMTAADTRLDDDGAFAGMIMMLTDTTAVHLAGDAVQLAELRLASVEELERQRIARSLHDGPLQMLVALSFQLNALANGGDVATAARSLEATTLSATRQLRETLEDLVPPRLAHGGLIDALAAVADRYALPDGPTVEMIDRTSTLMSEATAVALFLAGREALVNALLHASASSIRVELNDDADSFTLSVKDDGSGIDPYRSGRQQGHLGLRSIRERAIEAGGYALIEPDASAGTRVLVCLPRRGRDVYVTLDDPVASEG